MALFGKAKDNGLMDVIRCDEPSYLIWKWHPAGAHSFDNIRENAIRWGSSLRVKDGEVAVFVYRQKNGVMQDFIEGPYDEIIKTDNFPVLASIVGLAYQHGTPFQAEVYFVNLARIVQMPFAVPYFDLYDPRYLDFGVPTAVRGMVTFNISDYREFIKLHRLASFDLNAFKTQVRDSIARLVKGIVLNVPAERSIPIVQIERAIEPINEMVEESVRERFERDFGVNIIAVDINAIELDKSSDGYRQLMAVTKDITTAKVQAESADYVERLRIQREEGQYAQHKSTQTANMSAYQVEKQAEVGSAAANALGQMSSNGAGEVNLDSVGTGFNPAAMMAGMAVGGAVGQNLAGMMHGMMSASPENHNAVVPPPIPKESYHLAVNGQATGPYDIDSITQMAAVGLVSFDSLVWKNGMPNWKPAGTVEELSNLFKDMMPPIPPKEE